jgi:hypothetical protein
MLLAICGASTLASLRPTASGMDSPQVYELPGRTESTLRRSFCVVYLARSVEFLRLMRDGRV